MLVLALCRGCGLGGRLPWPVPGCALRHRSGGAALPDPVSEVDLAACRHRGVGVRQGHCERHQLTGKRVRGVNGDRHGRLIDGPWRRVPTEGSTSRVVAVLADQRCRRRGGLRPDRCRCRDGAGHLCRGGRSGGGAARRCRSSRRRRLTRNGRRDGARRCGDHCRARRPRHRQSHHGCGDHTARQGCGDDRADPVPPDQRDGPPSRGPRSTVRVTPRLFRWVGRLVHADTAPSSPGD